MIRLGNFNNKGYLSPERKAQLMAERYNRKRKILEMLMADNPGLKTQSAQALMDAYEKTFSQEKAAKAREEACRQRYKPRFGASDDAVS